MNKISVTMITQLFCFFCLCGMEPDSKKIKKSPVPNLTLNTSGSSGDNKKSATARIGTPGRSSDSPKTPVKKFSELTDHIKKTQPNISPKEDNSSDGTV